MKAAERAHQQWTLYAVGLIALQVLSVVFLQAPWTERSIRREDGVVHSGWEIIGSTIPGRGWVLLVVVCLVVSALATFAALSQRSSPAFYGVMGASLVQLLAIALMLNSAVVGVDSQLARHGVVLSIIAAIATIVTAAYARAEMVP